ncbi:MAG: peptidase S11 [Candidatus Collierbacteria bacterium GW2011_GWD2_42_50]|nr:MAG: peptidase S11 [Candidatus Collierbacteria bacterium GW2011_GWD2_42_50]
MKILLKNIFPDLRSVLNITALLCLFAYFIFVPIIKSPSPRQKPNVKAAFVSEPPMPVSKNISGIYITDLKTGQVLLEKNAHTRLKPASLTKIMTALVAMDYYNDDSILLVKNGQSANGNTVKLRKGDKLIASDLLYALLVPSGNDAAVTLAENYPGGYQAFISRMNSKVTEMNLQNTHFVNVSGVESQNHYTSAFDITALARAALARPQFSSIVSTQKITLKSLKGNIYPLETTNILLGQPGIFGVKTGWTPEAGECLVILVEKDNHSVLISILNSKDRFGEAQTLFNWVFENYSWE